MATTGETQWLHTLKSRKTLHAKERFSFGMGLLLTLLTAGLFIPIWLLIDVLGFVRPHKCQTCGRSKW